MSSIIVDPTIEQWGRGVGVDVVKEVHHVEARVDRILRSRPVPITIGGGTSTVIRQIGLGGVTDARTGAVSIQVAPTSLLPRHKMLTVQLRRTLAHELNHAARVTEGPGYGRTLLDVMVSEGLADNFATHLYPRSLALWDHALSQHQAHHYWQVAQDHLYEVLGRSAFDRWMFGRGRIPQWTGYTLGAGLVAAAHRRHPIPWARFTRQSADQISNESHYRT